MFKIIQKLALIYDNKILTLRRSSTDPRRPLTWDLIGGNVDTSDTGFGKDFLRQALGRELSEEIGIVHDPETFNVVDVRSNIDQKGNAIVWIVYYCHLKGPIEVNLSFEHDQYCWVSKEEFLELDFGYAVDDFRIPIQKLSI